MDRKRKHHFGDIFKDGIYEPLHRELFSPSAPDEWKDWLVPGFHEAAASMRKGGGQSAICEETAGVYSFDLFTPEFCDMLLEEVEHAERTARQQLERPNGMNRYGIVLNQLGLEPVITALQQEHLLPLQAALFPEDGAAADDHHCFIVRYRSGEDVGLDMHEDDSDVTLNVCLGKEFSAATLSFCGLAADEDHRRLSHTYSHRKGRAVMHLGRHRHGADDIAAGERVNFILWSTSNQYRSSDAYRRHRERSRSALKPDPVCLSYTHDKDYTEHLAKPTEEEAKKRGVMLDVVERRNKQRKAPVQDLVSPPEEINTRPSVILFMESLPAQRQHELFGDFMHIAGEVLSKAAGRSVPAPLFLVATRAMGAVPQVRGFCGAVGSPALAVLDIDKECCYRFQAGRPIDGASMGEFVAGFLRGALRPEPLGGAGSAPAQPDKEAEGTDTSTEAHVTRRFWHALPGGGSFFATRWLGDVVANLWAWIYKACRGVLGLLVAGR